MKIELSLIFCFLCISDVTSSVYKFTKIEACETSGKHGYIGSCSIAASTISVDVRINSTVDVVNAEIQLFQLQTNGNYRQLFKAPKVNWCLLTQQRNKNVVLKIIYDSLKNYASDLVRPCPLEPGSYRVNGLKLDRKIMSILPEGTYKFVVRCFNNLDEKLLLISVLMEVTQ